MKRFLCAVLMVVEALGFCDVRQELPAKLQKQVVKIISMEKVTGGFRTSEEYDEFEEKLAKLKKKLQKKVTQQQWEELEKLFERVSSDAMADKMERIAEEKEQERENERKENEYKLRKLSPTICLDEDYLVKHYKNQLYSFLSAGWYGRIPFYSEGDVELVYEGTLQVVDRTVDQDGYNRYLATAYGADGSICGFCYIRVKRQLNLAGTIIWEPLVLLYRGTSTCMHNYKDETCYVFEVHEYGGGLPVRTPYFMVGKE